jgi:nucleotide-binding universal stress UspA family protein
MNYAALMVYVDNGGQAAGRIALARDLAATFDAALIGVSGSTPRRPDVHPPARAALIGEHPESELEVAAANVQRAAALFEKVAGPHCRREWCGTIDYPARLIAREARGADLVIVGQDASETSPCDAADAGDVLMRAGRPVLVVPPTVHTSPAGAGVVIGWAETREARRAVSDALPFLQRARHVSVAHVYAEGERESACRCVDDVVAFLDRHKIKAEAVVQPRTGTSTAKQLVAIAREKHAGLIVMGGYGHARLREWAFGGVTREMLKASPVCLLLSH